MMPCRNRNGRATQLLTIMRKLGMVCVCLIAAAGSATTTDQGNRFVQTILVANKASFHPQIVNPDMINPWCIAVRPPGHEVVFLRKRRASWSRERVLVGLAALTTILNLAGSWW